MKRLLKALIVFALAAPFVLGLFAWIIGIARDNSTLIFTGWLMVLSGWVLLHRYQHERDKHHG